MQEELLHQLRARATSTPMSSSLRVQPTQNAPSQKNQVVNIDGDNNKYNNNQHRTYYADGEDEDVRTQVTKPMMTTKAAQNQQAQKTQIPLLPIQ